MSSKRAPNWFERLAGYTETKQSQGTVSIVTLRKGKHDRVIELDKISCFLIKRKHTLVRKTDLLRTKTIQRTQGSLFHAPLWKRFPLEVSVAICCSTVAAVVCLMYKIRL